MTFEEWAAPLRYAATLRNAYLAGQASVEERVKELEELVDRQQGFLSYWKAKCAELTRERDEAVRQWERFERMAGDNWAALKAQAGKPVCWIYELSGYRSIAWGSSKPDFPAAKNPVPLYTHPTTERETLLDAHARQVERECAEDEPVGYHFSYTSMTGAIGNEAAIEIEKLNYHREGLLIDLAHSLEREDTLKAKVADLEHEKDGMAKAYGFLVIERDRACEQHHEVARKLFELERAQPLAALVRDQEQRISELEWERDELERLFGVAFKQCEALKAQAGDYIRRWNIEPDGDDLLICDGNHDKHEKCEYIRYTPASTVKAQAGEHEEFECPRCSATMVVRPHMTPTKTLIDPEPVYAALLSAKVALCAVNSGASIKAIAEIDSILNQRPAEPVRTQVGEPCPLCHAREVLVTTEIVGRQIDDLLNPTTEPVKEASK